MLPCNGKCDVKMNEGRNGRMDDRMRTFNILANDGIKMWEYSC